MDRIQIISIFISGLLLSVIYGLVHKKKLRVEYSLLWFFMGLILLIVSFFRGLLERFSELMGVYYSPVALILVFIFLGILLAMHFSIIISKLSNTNEKLIQDLALLQHKVDNLEIEIAKKN